MRGHAELALLHPGPVPPEVTRALERIAAESTRMGAMVDDLLLLARLDAGRPLRREPVDLARLVLDAVTDARAAGPEHHWFPELPEEPVLVPGDEHRLHQLLANLTSHARLHTPPGTTVTVGVAPGDDGTAHLTVTDNGPGIPAALRGGLFERFGHGEGPRGADGGGTGLGLSIVVAVAAAHGGTATVTSDQDTTRFTVRLPYPDPDTAHDPSRSPPAAAGARPARATAAAAGSARRSPAARGSGRRPSARGWGPAMESVEDGVRSRRTLAGYCLPP